MTARAAGVKKRSRKVIDITHWRSPPVEDLEEVYQTAGQGPGLLNTLGRKHRGLRTALKSMAGLGLAVGFVVLAALTTGPMDYDPPAGAALPPIRDVSLPPPALWTWDDKAFIDPPGPETSWKRVALVQTHYLITHPPSA